VSRNGFDELGRLSGIAQGLPYFLDGIIYADIEVHEGVCLPDLLPDFFALDHFPGVLK
jgi:hypothetical protein